MTDIVERLRACHGIPAGDPDCCCAEAADVIERLQAQMTIFQNVNRTDAAEIERLQRYINELFDHLRSREKEIERLQSLVAKPKPYSSGCEARAIPGATCQSPNCDC